MSFSDALALPLLLNFMLSSNYKTISIPYHDKPLQKRIFCYKLCCTKLNEIYGIFCDVPSGNSTLCQNGFNLHKYLLILLSFNFPLTVQFVNNL